jgi:hypothetical protein
MPFYGLADGISRLATDESLTSNIYDLLGAENRADSTATPDLLMYGFPSLLGFSLQGRASAPGADLMRDMSMFANMAIVPRAQALGRLVGSAYDAASMGMNPLGDNQVQDQLAQFLAPRTLQRWMSLGGDNSLRSLRTGNSLLPAMGEPQAWMHILGLTPLEVAKAFDLSSEAWKDQKTTRARVSAFGEELADAWMAGDRRGARLVLGRAAAMGLPVDSITRSATARMSKRMDPLLDRQFRDDAIAGQRRARGI